jgi:3-dehydroquinate synthase
MNTLRVELGDRSYPIYIGAGLLERAELLRAHIVKKQVLVVTNTTVGPLYRGKIEQALAGLDVAIIELPDGELHKNLETANQIYSILLEKRFDRTCTMVALGGGVVGDITGFVAATYQRGVAFVQIPTTLLAQVDSSVGGKTGVNHPLGKNMIGAFHQPLAVLADTATLNTLADRELSAGLAEVIKYGLINDLPFLDWIETNLARLRTRDPAALAYAIERSCANKARIVASDERENGQRALLNLGHTFGHAIESATGYSTWLHGEAVGVGMCMAADLSQRQGWISGDDRERVERVVAAAGLPTQVPQGITAAQFNRYMSRDKKVLAGQLRLVLMRSLGDSVVTADFDAASLDATLASFASV